MKRVIHLAALCLAAILAFTSCSQPADGKPPEEPVQSLVQGDPGLSIVTNETSFVVGRPAQFAVRVDVPEATDATLMLSATDGVSLKPYATTVKLAKGVNTLPFSGTPQFSGFSSITAMLEAQGALEPLGGEIGIHVSEAGGLSLLSTDADAPVETTADYLASLPETVSLTGYGNWRDRQERAVLAGQRPPNLPVKLKDVAIAQSDAELGTTAEKSTTIMEFAPGTGSGKPLPGELEGVPPGASASRAPITTQANCGTTRASVRFQIKNKDFKTGAAQAVDGVEVKVYDNNGVLLPDTLIAKGNTDNLGYFRYNQNICDRSSWFDTSKPDIYYVIESRDNRKMFMYNVFALNVGGYDYTYTTSTNWNTSSTSFSVTLDAHSNGTTRAFWLFKLLRIAQNGNVAAGGGGGTYMPLNIDYPATILAATAPNAYVSKLNLQLSSWNSTYDAWHEFGHEVMYYTATPAAYNSAFNKGIEWNGIPSFAWGSHKLYERQGYQLAYNEGWANYFYSMIGLYYAKISVPDNFYKCTQSSTCPAYRNGGENEMRASTFLHDYTTKVLSPNLGFTPTLPSGSVSDNLKAYGRVRGSLYNAGNYRYDINDAWRAKIRLTKPSTLSQTDFNNKVRAIAVSTYMDTRRVP